MLDEKILTRRANDGFDDDDDDEDDNDSHNDDVDDGSADDYDDSFDGDNDDDNCNDDDDDVDFLKDWNRIKISIVSSLLLRPHWLLFNWNTCGGLKQNRTKSLILT